MGILIPLILIFLTCLLIWRACDGFELASEYIGRNLSDGVRGATINAISSSIPELLTTLIALFVLQDRDGFAIGIGTTAGSALFNGMIIPAACILAVVGTTVAGVRVSSVNVSTKVLLRDGLSLILCEVILILLINGRSLHWWQGLILIAMYAVYVIFMFRSMTLNRGNDLEDDSAVSSKSSETQLDCGDEQPDSGRSNSLVGRAVYWLSLGPLMDLERIMVREKHRRQIEQETWNGWPLLLASTAVLAMACWLLVIACEWLGTPNESHDHYELFGHQFTGLGMPAMFVAVIFASMATSVPDTVMSIRDARDGDYDDAVANALGSNIFDICFALGFPLFLFTLVHGPIHMSQEVVRESGELRFMLLLLTLVGFFVYYVGRRGRHRNGTPYVEMRRGKALALFALYLGFVLYVVARIQQSRLVVPVSEWIQQLLAGLPTFG